MMNNEEVLMTRRYPDLRKKVLERDSKIAKRLIAAWDVEHDAEKVLSIYLKEMNNLSNERYWELMRSVWIICGNVEYAPRFKQLMSSNRDKRYYFSTPEEAKKLREMPQQIQIFRATNDENDGGISWSISIEYVQWYREAFNK